MDEFSTRFELIRNDAKLNKAEFSRKLGIKSTYYSDILRGDRPVNTKLMIAAHQVFGVNLNWFLTGTGNTYRSDLEGIVYFDMTRTIEFFGEKASSIYSSHKFDDLPNEVKKKILSEINEFVGTTRMILETKYLNKFLENFLFGKTGDPFVMRSDLSAEFPVFWNKLTKIQRKNLLEALYYLKIAQVGNIECNRFNECRSKRNLASGERGELFIEYYKILDDTEKVDCLKKLLKSNDFMEIVLNNDTLNQIFKNVVILESENRDNEIVLSRFAARFISIFNGLQFSDQLDILKNVGEFPDITGFFSEFNSVKKHLEYQKKMGIQIPR